MAQMAFFLSDKEMAAPTKGASQPLQFNPRNERRTFKITIEVVGADNKGVQAPITIGSNESASTLFFFDSDYHIIEQDDDAFIHTKTRQDGRQVIYLCSPLDVLFTLLARIDEPGQSFRAMSLLFFDFDLPAAALPPPNLPLANGQMRMPPWYTYQYATLANTPLGLAGYDMAATVCNDFARIGEPSIVSSDFKIPYQEILPRGSVNRVAYLFLAGGNTICSPVLQFTATGQGLVMPDPDKLANHPAPQWEDGPVSRLTSYEVGNGLVLLITMVDDVQEGDTYEVHIYLNGYDSAGLVMPPAEVQTYTVKAPKGVKPRQQVPCAIGFEHLVGYRFQSPQNWGYMWADCLITSAAWDYQQEWTRPWGPIGINFFPL